MKKIMIIVFLSIGFIGLASPERSMQGAVLPQRIEEGSSEPTYILDGLQRWFDGILSQWDIANNLWFDILNGYSIANVQPGDGCYAKPLERLPYAKCREYLTVSDFTVHGLIETPKNSEWRNWCCLGIGDNSSAGLENGIVLSCRNNPMAVCYRSTYSGTVHNSVPLSNVKYGDTIVLDIVFHYTSLTYEVYVNGEYVGASTILSENWNLDGKHLQFGLQFHGTTDTNRNCKMYNVMIYNRALSAEEVEHNFEMDMERFAQ